MRLVSLVHFVTRSNSRVEWRFGQRTGRLPLPRQVAELTPNDVPALETVNAFVDLLVGLPLAAWLDIGRSISSDREGLRARRDAWDQLDTTITAQRLGLSAWYVRDAVETAAFLASRCTPRWSAEERRMFAAAHGAAETAALALLARVHLSAETLGILCAPFESYEPAPTAQAVVSL